MVDSMLEYGSFPEVIDADDDLKPEENYIFITENLIVTSLLKIKTTPLKPSRYVMN